jgi:acetyl esterase/lipase
MRSAVLWTLFVVPGLLLAQEKPAEKIVVERDVVFGKGGNTELKLDLAMPKEGKGPFPAVVCIHGGGWKGGSYKDMSRGVGLIQRLADNGFVAISCQYRLTPTGKFPDQVEDCKCAVRWLRANADRYKVDPKNIGAVGFSAGGHLVLLLGLTSPEDNLEGNGDLTEAARKQSSRVQAVANFFGPTDMTTGDWDSKVQPLLTDFLGGLLEDKRDNYRRASPVTYVRKDPNNPAIMTFHGTKDEIVRYKQATILDEALKKVGVTMTLVTMEGDGHGWSGDKIEKSLRQTLEFFNKELRKQ